jgi:hypothetical protein
MTEAERRDLRAAIDAARRARLAAEAAAGLAEAVCARCGVPIDVNPSRPTKRYCSKNCRVYHWYHTTERGRVALIGKNRRRRRRQVMPRRPNAEVPL